MKVGDRVRVKAGQGCLHYYQEGAEGTRMEDGLVKFDKGKFDPKGMYNAPIWACCDARVELVEPTQDVGAVETTMSMSEYGLSRDRKDKGV